MKNWVFVSLLTVSVTVGAVWSLNLEIGEPDLIKVDPYRAAYQDESVVFNWLIQESVDILNDEKLKLNSSIQDLDDVLDQESIDKLSTTVDFNTWELTFGKDVGEALSKQQVAAMEMDKRTQVPFFDPADMKEFGVDRLNDFRDLIGKMAFRTFHRDKKQVDENNAPLAFIGFAAEDDLDYEWPLRKFGDKNGVYLNVTTKGLQMTNMVKVLAEKLTVLVKKGKVDKAWADRMINGGRRFILGFGLHEVFHSYQFYTVPVRNNSQPEFKESMKNGFFSDIKTTDFPKLDYSKMSYEDFLKGAFEQTRKEIDVLRRLTDSKKHSRKRAKAIRDFKRLFPRDKKAKINHWLRLSSDDLWMKHLAPYIERNKSVFWDSVAKVQVYEIEGFGFNRTLIKGHEKDLREVGYLLHMIRVADTSDEVLEAFQKDQDLDSQHIDGMKAMRDDTAVAKVIKLLNNSEGDFSESMYSQFNGVEGKDKREAPFSLLTWDPANKHLGNDTVGYYFLWDADMSWMGFSLEPPVKRLLQGQWEPLFINNKLIQIHGDVAKDKKKCAKYQADVVEMRSQMQESPNYMQWAAEGEYTPFVRLQSVWPELPFNAINDSYVKLMKKVVSDCNYDKDLVKNL